MARRFAVIGLGHFGSSLAVELASRNAEVLAIDNSMERLDDIKDRVAHTIRLDATRKQHCAGWDCMIWMALVAIGDDFEATLLTVTQLHSSRSAGSLSNHDAVHERILAHLGIAEIILPRSKPPNGFQQPYDGGVVIRSPGSNYTIMEVNAPEWMLGKPLQEIRMREA
jgi:trk system potassium uptake protein TrkA